MIRPSFSSQSAQSFILAVALVTLATGAGVMAQGAWLPLALLCGGFTALGLWAAGRDWLVRPDREASPAQRVQMLLVIAASFFFALFYVRLTGGAHSPLSFALYLPIALAAICFGSRAGVGTALGIAFIYIVGIGWRDSTYALSHEDWEGAVSFPLVAVAVSLLTKRNEERLAALYHRNRELDMLLDISQMIDASIDLEMMLNLILLNVQKLTNCQVCAIYLVDAAGGHLELRNTSMPRNHNDLQMIIPVSDLDPKKIETIRPDLGARATALFPLTCVEGLVGLLYVGDENQDALRPTDLAHVKQLADRTGFSLQRAMTKETAESLAYRDAMTGLDNYRQFERTLQEEILRADRYGRPLSLLMLDIDHFKKYNDTLGHQAGDALLAQIGTILRNALRSVDRPARYGGEEFAVILPETGADEAYLIAERIRRAVAETPFALTNLVEETAHVTLSVGYATAPQDARAPADLIKRADAALYAAKHGGRNAVRGQDVLELPRLAA